MADSEELSIFNSAFEKDYGISLEVLAANYDRHVEEKNQRLNDELDRVRTEFNNIRSDLNTVRSELLAELNRSQTELGNLYKSRSWRITAPMRYILEKQHIFLKKISRLFHEHK